MAYQTFTPVDEMPTDPPADVPGSVELQHYNGANVYVTDGNGVYCLIQYFNGAWFQYGPEWTLPAPAGQGDVGRIAIERDKGFYHVLRKSGTGGEEETAVIRGVHRG